MFKFKAEKQWTSSIIQIMSSSNKKFFIEQI